MIENRDLVLAGMIPEEAQLVGPYFPSQKRTTPRKFRFLTPELPYLPHGALTLEGEN